MKGAGVVTLALGMLCLPLSGQQFWGGTKFGMTKSQIKALFGNQVTVGSTPADQGGAALEMDHSFCGTTFHVAFGFKSGSPGLTGVLLSNADVEKGAQIGRCALREYTAAYGKPINVEERYPGSASATITSTFAKGDTVVEVETSRTLTEIYYRLRPKEL